MTSADMFTWIKNNKNWRVIKTKKHELNYQFYAEGETAYLFYQESDGKKDWADNLNFLPIYTKVYKNQEGHLLCHNGFVKEYKSGNDQVMADFIDFIKDNNSKIYIISGWSNGAAMAILAAEDFYYRTQNKPIVITFGSPMVCFDKKSADHILNRCVFVKEYCHQNDIVTKLPPLGKHVNKYKLGRFNPLKILNPWQWHTHYDEFIKDEDK